MVAEPPPTILSHYLTLLNAPSCFNDDAGLLACCDDGLGSFVEDFGCWQEGRTYENCCLGPAEDTCDLNAARLRVIRKQLELGDTGSQQMRYMELWPELPPSEQEHLRDMCCSGYDTDCWDAESDGVIYDMSTSYVQCCFPRLRQYLQSDPPRWLSEEVDRALQGARGYAPAAREAFEEHCASDGGPARDHRHLLCRLQADAGTGVRSSCDIAQVGLAMGYERLHGYLDTLLRALHILSYLSPKPLEADFFVNVLDMALYNFTVPVCGGNRYRDDSNVVLLPHEWQLNVVAHRYSVRIPQWDQLPWEEKIPVVYWRGGLSAEYEYWAEGDGARPLPPADCRWDGPGVRMYHRGPHNISNWYTHPRGRLAMLSTYTDLIDAKITGLIGLWQHPQELREEIKASLDKAGVLGERRPPEEVANYRYLIVPDASDRAYFLLWFNAVVFLAESAVKHWGMGLLTPWRHYIPVKHDLSDLLEKVAWAQAHDEECKLIARRARKLAKLIFGPDMVLAYFHLLTQRLARLDA